METRTDEYRVVYRVGKKSMNGDKHISYGHFDEYSKAQRVLPPETRELEYQGGKLGLTKYPDGHYIAVVKVY